MKRRIQHLTEFAKHFLLLEAAGGIVMIATALLALILVNSPVSTQYHLLLGEPIVGHMNLSLFVKDVLMVIFFFAVGMELKCEMREGALSQKGQKILPLVAAVGGIVIPAALYLLITRFHPELRAGWAIPTATDIAFALCVLKLIGPSIPQPAKIFLLAIAIYDDLAAILIIALFYSTGLALIPLAAVAALTGVLYVLNRTHITHLAPYLLVGIAMWFALHEAGIHPTIAGVFTALAIPMRTRKGKPLLAKYLHRLHPYVAFGVLPLFAFTAAGVDVRDITPAQLFSPLPVAITFALFFGKQIGIFWATFACVKLGLAPLPKHVTWRLVYGVSILAGIGFTMSLFIGELAFSAPGINEEVKLGVLTGSLLSSFAGFLYLRTHRTA